MAADCTVSYDVNKDGVKVAVLTFTKSAYRLGETVLGVVELNERQGRSRVLSVGPPLLGCHFWLITCPSCLRCSNLRRRSLHK